MPKSKLHLPWTLPSTLRFEDDVEKLYFGKFQKEVLGFQDSGFNRRGYWNKVVPQACHEEPFALGLVMALAASLVAQELAVIAPLLAAQHSTFAVNRYQKALASLRKCPGTINNPRTGGCFRMFIATNSCHISTIMCVERTLTESKPLLVFFC